MVEDVEARNERLGEDGGSALGWIAAAGRLVLNQTKETNLPSDVIQPKKEECQPNLPSKEKEPPRFLDYYYQPTKQKECKTCWGVRQIEEGGRAKPCPTCQENNPECDVCEVRTRKKVVCDGKGEIVSDGPKTYSGPGGNEQ
jgi:hypothetical protein